MDTMDRAGVLTVRNPNVLDLNCADASDTVVRNEERDRDIHSDVSTADISDSVTLTRAKNGDFGHRPVHLQVPSHIFGTQSGLVLLTIADGSCRCKRREGFAVIARDGTTFFSSVASNKYECDCDFTLHRNVSNSNLVVKDCTEDFEDAVKLKETNYDSLEALVSQIDDEEQFCSGVFDIHHKLKTRLSKTDELTEAQHDFGNQVMESNDEKLWRGKDDVKQIPEEKKKGAVYGMIRLRHPGTVCLVLYPVSSQRGSAGTDSGRERDSKGTDKQSDSDGDTGRPPPRPPPQDLGSVPWAMLRQELYRLGTFSQLQFPPTNHLFVLQLARAGFVLLDNVLVCYFCCWRHSEGQIPDSNTLFETHRRESPGCPRVTATECGNQPVQVVPADQRQQLLQFWSVYDSPAGQLPPTATVATTATAVTATVAPPVTADAPPVGHPPVVSPPALPTVMAGSDQGHAQLLDLSQDGATDRAGSHGQRQGTSSQVSQGSQQQLSNSSQPPVQRIIDGTAQPQTANSSTASAESEGQSHSGSQRSTNQVVTYQQLGIVTEAPKQPEMAMMNARLPTFRNWPQSSSHTPLQLAEAGFCYAGYADCGRCFFCGGGLKNWEPGDDPWVEHARWFPKCPYIRQCQGQDFIDLVQELHASGQHISWNQVTDEIRQRRAAGEHIQEPWSDPAIVSVRELGYSQQDVDFAVQAEQREGHMLTAERLYDRLVADNVEPSAPDTNTDIPAVTEADLGNMENLARQSNEIRQTRTCKICLDREVCVVFLPCGHLVCCTLCAPALQHCPVCRQRIRGRVRCFPA